MPRNEKEVLEGLRLEYESANAATSASAGLTPLQSGSEASDDDDAAAKEDYQPHSLQ